MKVFYHDDPDGRLSAFWVHDFCEQHGQPLLQQDLIGLEYKDRVPLERVKAGEPVFVVDFAFDVEVMRSLLTLTDNVIWIDHHQSNIGRYDELLKEFNKTFLAGLHDIRFSACVLTWWYLNRYIGVDTNTKLEDRQFYRISLAQELCEKSFLLEPPFFTVLLGDWDAWRHEFGEETQYFYTGLQLRDTSPLSDVWKLLANDPSLCHVMTIKDQGAPVVRYKEQFAKEYCHQWGFETVFEDKRAFAVNMARTSSKFFESIEQEGTEFDYEVFISFVQSSTGYTISLYSDKVDVSLLAKKHGGGGHKGAAGFCCETLPFPLKYSLP